MPLRLVTRPSSSSCSRPSQSSPALSPRCLAKLRLLARLRPLTIPVIERLVDDLLADVCYEPTAEGLAAARVDEG